MLRRQRIKGATTSGSSRRSLRNTRLRRYRSYSWPPSFYLRKQPKYGSGISRALDLIDTWYGKHKWKLTPTILSRILTQWFAVWSKGSIPLPRYLALHSLNLRHDHRVPSDSFTKGRHSCSHLLSSSNQLDSCHIGISTSRTHSGRGPRSR